MFEAHELRVTSYLPQEGYGAGGMTVGMTTSGIIVHHISSGIGVSCDSERSQHANKERAIALLWQILKPIDSASYVAAEKVYNDFYAVDAPSYTKPENRTMGHVVNMIKEVREKSGCGLREAKMAVDSVRHDCSSYDGVIGRALAHLGIRDVMPVLNPVYTCALGEWCCCGGDVPAVRAGCYNYSEV